MISRALLLAASAALFALTPAPVLRANATAAPVAPDAVLTLLREGNARFAADHPTHPAQSTERRAEVAKGQHPVAIVIACADSRVPP